MTSEKSYQQALIWDSWEFPGHIILFGCLALALVFLHCCNWDITKGSIKNTSDPLSPNLEAVMANMDEGAYAVVWDLDVGYRRPILKFILPHD